MNYQTLISAIREAHQQAQAGTAGAINRHHVMRNWIIGAYLVEFQQAGEDRAVYGTRLLKRVSADLREQAVPGTSVDQLERMRLLYLTYPQLADGNSAPLTRKLLPPAAARAKKKSASLTRKSVPALPAPLSSKSLLQLSWTHFAELVRLDDPWKRAFYEIECLKGNWSVRQLQRQIGSLLFDRTALSTDKMAVIEHARQQAVQAPNLIAELIRDPYVLEFTGLVERPRYLEKDLENALLDYLQTFLLELGTGFCFEARQKRVTVGGEHDHIDLVFYHRLLRCHLLIDLKTRPFRHGDAGQMNFYLNFWKTSMMIEGDQPPVGLILCTDKQQTRVDYATAGLDHQLFVSRYMNVLPSTETLERLIEQDTAIWRQQHDLEA